MEPESAADITLRVIVGAVFRHKGKAFLFLLLALAGAVAWNIVCPLKFRSEGKLLVRVGRENATLEPTVTLGHEQILTVPQMREQETNSVVEVLNSRAIAEKVVDDVGSSTILGLADNAPGPDSHPAATQARVEGAKDTAATGMAHWFSTWKDWILAQLVSAQGNNRDRAVRALVQDLEVVPVAKSNIIRVAYQASTPQVSQEVLTKVIEAFLEAHGRLNRSPGADQFLADQTDRLRAELDGTEQSLRQLKEDTGLVSPEGRKDILVKRVGRLEDDLLQASAELAAAESSVESLRKKVADLPATQTASQTVGIGDEGTNLMRDRLYGLQAVKEEADAKYAESHPKRLVLKQQLDAAQEILGKEERSRTQVTIAPSKTHEQATLDLMATEVRLTALQAKTASLRAQLAEGRDALRTFAENEARVTRLQREKEIQEGRYRKCSAVVEEVRLDTAMEARRMSNISIVQPASFDLKPVQPRRLFNLLVGLAVGLAGGLGVVLVSEYFDRPFTSPEEKEERLRVPRLVSRTRLPRAELSPARRD